MKSTVGYTLDLINHITVVRRKVILIMITSNTFIFTTHPKSHMKINELEKNRHSTFLDAIYNEIQYGAYLFWFFKTNPNPQSLPLYPNP